MNIGHIVSSLLIAGIQRFVVSLARQQVADGHRVVVFVLNGTPDPDLAAELDDVGATIVCLNKQGRRDPRALRRLGRLVAHHDVQVLHTHGYPLVYALPVATLQGIPIVHTLHALMEVEVAAGASAFYRAAIASRVPFAAISQAVAESFEARFGLRPLVIDSGVDLARFAAPVDREAVRRQYGVPRDATVVTTVARAEPVKGVDIALDAFCRIAADHPNAHWVMAGVGSSLSDLREQTPAELRDRVHLVGLVADVPPLLQASDIFLLTSRSEGLGLSVIEALAAGLPSVVFPVGGLGEVVLHEHNGLVTDDTTADAAARALHRLLTDDNLASACARRAAESVERFSLARASEAYVQRYRAGQRSRSRRWVRFVRRLWNRRDTTKPPTHRGPT